MLGRLAAGVGHEINNPLAIVSGNVRRAKKRTENLGDEKLRSNLEKSEIGIQRIADIVSGLRTFSRADSDTVKSFNLNTSLSQSVSLIQEIFEKSGVRLSFQFPQESVHVLGNEGRIQQVVMNLLTNAKDALKESTKKEVNLALRLDGSKCEVGVADSGPGIPEELQEKIFTPFFTTKEVGEGTGIGLSLSSSIVAEHDGELTFTTSRNGTCFKFVLPVAQVIDDQKVMEESAPKKESVKHNLKKVLIVDDEPGIREILKENLEDLNCEVYEAENGIEALSKLEKNSFSIVFTDVQMPEMDGLELLKNVHLSYKGNLPRLVVVTGGTNIDLSPQSELVRLSDGVIMKPFSPEEIEEILERSSTNQVA